MEQLAGRVSLLFLMSFLLFSSVTKAQQSSDKNAKPPTSAATQDANPDYSGMYTFLKDGEFVQLTVEDQGIVTGFISRYGDQESDLGAFLNQFFKTAKLEKNRLQFTTQIVHGIAYSFNGELLPGDGKSPQDEGYHLLKGTLTETVTQNNKPDTVKTRQVVFRSLPNVDQPAQ